MLRERQRQVANQLATSSSSSSSCFSFSLYIMSTSVQLPVIRAFTDDSIKMAPGTTAANETPLTRQIFQAQLSLSESFFQFLPWQPKFFQHFVCLHTCWQTAAQIWSGSLGLLVFGVVSAIGCVRWLIVSGGPSTCLHAFCRHETFFTTLLLPAFLVLLC